jgi:hypothetical protein
MLPSVTRTLVAVPGDRGHPRRPEARLARQPHLEDVLVDDHLEVLGCVAAVRHPVHPPSAGTAHPRPVVNQMCSSGPHPDP